MKPAMIATGDDSVAELNALTDSSATREVEGRVIRGRDGITLYADAADEGLGVSGKSASLFRSLNSSGVTRSPVTVDTSLPLTGR